MNAPAAASALSPAKDAFQYVPVDRLLPSSTNPRKHFDEQRLAELAKTIGEHGVLEPILVRAIPKKDAYEIVAGERRWRAAKLAKRPEVPVILRELTDKQALEIQTIENAQREDLHPLEQAEGYERLIKDFGYTPESIADRIGKSRAHVFQIRKLRSLAPKLREAFAAGDMDTTLATVVARVPGAALQEQAWQQLKREHPEGFSFRLAADFIRKHWMLDLTRAPFNIQDASLRPEAGTCGGCPKRTGNQPDLFQDIKNGNVCTDPACFIAKRDAARAREIKTIEAKGTTVLVGADAKKIMPYGNGLGHGLGYHMARDTCWDDPKRRTWGQLAKEANAPTTMVQDPQSGNLVPVLKDADVKKALEAKGVKLFRTHDSSRAETAARARQKADDERRRLESEARRLAWLGIRAKIARLDPPELTAIAIGYWKTTWHEHLKRVCEAWKWPNNSGGLDERIRKLKPAELARLLVDLTLVHEVQVRQYSSTPPKQLEALGRRHGVRLDQIRARIFKEAKLKKATKAAEAKKKTAKAPGKAKVTKPAPAKARGK